MIYDSAHSHAQKLQSRDYTSADLVDAYYRRTLNPKLNAIVISNETEAKQLAAKLDQENDFENLGKPLYGVPVTVKESFKMRGTPTTINYPPLKNYIADQDSVIVRRLRDAGAIILGKTNIPTLLSDSQTFGPLYPTANNPYDVSRIPGGSTGGGAAAVAAGLTTFEIGSDIGGSIRNPSHYCGLYGLKPTHNSHQQDGHVPPLPGKNMGFAALSSTGPLARSVSDIELAYNVIYAPRPEYRRFLDIKTGHPEPESLSGLRFAYYDELLGLQAGKDVQAGIQKLTSRIEAAGGSVTKISIDTQLSERIVQTWARLFGFVAGQDFGWATRKIMKFMFNRDIKHSRLNAKKALAEGLSLNFKAYSNALYEQQELIAEFHRKFEEYDFILSPTSPGPAFEHNHKHRDIMLDGQAVAYLDYCFMFVSIYNALELPVLTVPSGLNSQGLPIGISITAPHHTERSLIALGKLLENEGFVFQPPELS